jgi:hypothetical protein
MKTAGLVLLTALSAFAAISGVVFDFRATHIYNPAWRSSASGSAGRPERQEIARAIPKAAAAARPPISMVWSALRIAGAPVNRPFT